MRTSIKHLVIGAVLALALGYGVAVTASMDCYMVACGCTWQATNCAFCEFTYSGGECMALRNGCEAFTLNCNINP